MDTVTNIAGLLCSDARRELLRCLLRLLERQQRRQLGTPPGAPAIPFWSGVVNDNEGFERWVVEGWEIVEFRDGEVYWTPPGKKAMYRLGQDGRKSMQNERGEDRSGWGQWPGPDRRLPPASRRDQAR